MNKYAFEQWALANVGQASLAGKYVRDGRFSYTHNIVELCWQAWQAACGQSEE